MCASASRWEGFNLPLAEAQFYGRPVVAYDVDGAALAGRPTQVEVDVELGALSPMEVSETPATQAREKLYDLFGWQRQLPVGDAFPARTLAQPGRSLFAQVSLAY